MLDRSRAYQYSTSWRKRAFKIPIPSLFPSGGNNGSGPWAPTPKQAPLQVTEAEFNKNRDAYKAQSTWWEPKPVLPRNANAKVVLISGYKDEQTSMDGPVNGAFTGAFLQVWNNGNYRKNYNDRKDDVVAQVGNPDQIPCIFPYGVNVEQMLPQVPVSDETHNAIADKTKVI